MESNLTETPLIKTPYAQLKEAVKSSDLEKITQILEVFKLQKMLVLEDVPEAAEVSNEIYEIIA